MKAFRRFTDHRPVGRPLGLASDHIAVRQAHTLFRKNVMPSAAMERLLKSGQNNRKIGSRIVKGRLAGLPIFTLTLEERATCPRSCEHWLSCYGNKMHWPKRIKVDGDFLPKLRQELIDLEREHGRFMVRLHVLGDFYSVPYVRFWHKMLEALPGLHIFGYTARRKGEMADLISDLNASPRAWIRFSNGDPRWRPFRTVSIMGLAEAADAIVCPAQHHPKANSICCGSCALCWTTHRPIAFLQH